MPTEIIFQLLLALLSGSGDGLSDQAQSEYDLVLSAAGPTQSPLFGYTLDYGQLQVRAGYADLPRRSRFFQAWRYAATALFPLFPSAALGLQQDAGPRLQARLRQLAGLGVPFVTAVERLQADTGKLVPGRSGSVSLHLVAEETPEGADYGQRLLFRARAAGQQPQVLHGTVQRHALEPGLKPADAFTGFRLVALREALDSRLFQRLVFDATGAWHGTEEVDRGVIQGFGPAKVRPLVDEFVALLGHTPLTSELPEDQARRIAGYARGWIEARQWLESLESAEAGRMQLLSTYLNAFMVPPNPWQQRVETVKGLWTELKHAELLYQAQSTTVQGKGLVQIPTDQAARGAVIEAVPAALLQLQHYSATLAGLFPSAVSERWQKLADWLDRCVALATQVQDGQSLAVPDETFLRTLPGQLAQLVSIPSAPVVVDIHKGVDGNSMERVFAATGWVGQALQQHNGRHYRGARYRFYSFRQINNRLLTDADWQQMLGFAPDPAIRLPQALERSAVLAEAGAELPAQELSVTLAAPSDLTAAQQWIREHHLDASWISGRTFITTLPAALLSSLAQQPWAAAAQPQMPMEEASPGLEAVTPALAPTSVNSNQDH